MKRTSLSLLVPGVLFLLGTEPSAAQPPEPDQHLSGVEFVTTLTRNHGRKTISGPALHMDREQRLHLAWIEGNDQLNLYYLRTPSNANSLPEPIQANPADVPVASAHEPPALTLDSTGAPHLTWTTPHPQAGDNPFATLLQLSHLQKGKDSFEEPLTVNDDDQPASHGFETLTVDQDGTVHVAWIDGREGQGEFSTYTAHSTSINESGRLSKNLNVDGNTCPCCRIDAVTAPDGTLYLAWRKVFEENIRETVVARSTDGGNSFSTPVIVGHDRWSYQACPHRSASVGVDAQGRLYVVWYTEGPDDVPGIYLAMSDDGGRTFTPRRKLNDSQGTFPDHPQMAVDEAGRLLIVWEEQSPVRREVVMRYSPDRSRTFTRPIKLSGVKGTHPAVTLNPEGNGAIAWIEQVFPVQKTVIQFVSLSDSEEVPDAPHH